MLEFSGELVQRPFEWYLLRVFRRLKRGFSLAEMMVTLMLLSVISLVLTGLIPATITGMAKAAMRTNASLLAENRIAQIQQSGFGRVEETTAPHETHMVGKTEYKLRVEIEDARLSNGDFMEKDVAKLIRVVINWEDKQGAQTYSGQAVMFKRI